MAQVAIKYVLDGFSDTVIGLAVQMHRMSPAEREETLRLFDTDLARTIMIRVLRILDEKQTRRLSE